MKKIVLVSFTLALLAALAAGPAQAYSYTFADNTQVEAYQQGRPSTAHGYTGWFDVVGTPSKFNTLGADLVNGHLLIYSNWSPARDRTEGAYTADLFISVAGSSQPYDYAIRLDGWGQGNVYENPDFFTSNDLFRRSDDIYGGKYENNGVKDVPVWASDRHPQDKVDVDWYGSTRRPDAYKGATFEADIDLTGLDLGNDWYFVWGTGTCANDTIVGHYHACPIPGDFFLFGSGLLGLAAYGWRKRDLLDSRS